MGDKSLSEAYALSNLWNKLKDQGLELLEEQTKLVYEAFKEYLKEGAEASKPLWDDVPANFLDQLDKFAYPAIDKINPADNEQA